ncbi:MAG: SufE family protein [Gammaproteobacteria bacterium]|jgi:cysteine desulfuration protein SufE|nr:SufE family protein [Gammaproteobacteria bacterium]MDH5239884.1 SufE family protein [Gammaproteobacteria bacterium]MDH5260388.1 SufE family protein [Gammaproteobacteria bacterium]MDH5583893.1 SufE family protein [Gammaproteobacteria bacterium]
MSNEIDIAQRELIEDFEMFDDWIDRYQYIIDMGRRLPEFPEACKTDEHRIRGCQAQVWFVANKEDGRLYFQAISDAAIVSGLIALLLRLYSGRRPEDILETPPDFVSALQLESHLSPTRSTGLSSMLTAIRRFASEAAAEA